MPEWLAHRPVSSPCYRQTVSPCRNCSLELPCPGMVQPHADPSWTARQLLRRILQGAKDSGSLCPHQRLLGQLVPERVLGQGEPHFDARRLRSGRFSDRNLTHPRGRHPHCHRFCALLEPIRDLWRERLGRRNRVNQRIGPVQDALRSGGLRAVQPGLRPRAQRPQPWLRRRRRG
jgi:hypothetical protein